MNKLNSEKSGVYDLWLTLRLQIDRERNTDNDKDNDDSDKIDKNIFDRTVAAVNEQLMIFVEDRVKDRKP